MTRDFENHNSARAYFNKRLCVRLLAAFILLSFSGLSGPVIVAANDLKQGDLLVGVTYFGSPSAGNTKGAIALVRDGAASIFCQAPAFTTDPNFWDIPTSVIADSQGRVVFLAVVGRFSGAPAWALLRCDGIGATAEKLAIFPSTSAVLSGYPVPYPGQIFTGVTGLHLTTLNTISLNDLAAGVTSQDAYNLISVSSGTPTHVRYLATDQTWEPSTDIIQTGCCVVSQELPDVISHSGATYSVRGNYFEKVQDPLRVEVSGTVAGTSFSAILNLFESANTLNSTYTFDSITPMIPSGCPPPLGGILSTMPVNRSGVFAPFEEDAGFVVYDEFTGYNLVVTTEFAPLYPFLANINEALFDSPSDPSLYFQDNFLGCAATPYLQFNPPLPFFDNATGFSNSTIAKPASSVNGLMALDAIGDIFQVVSGTKAQIVLTGAQFNAAGVAYPESIGAYPNGVSAGLSTTVVVRVDSPVNVLITDPNGKQLGVDAFGNSHNDFSGTIVNPITGGGSQNINNGFDSGPGEPRFFAIKNPVPGMYNVQSIGTGSGPYTVRVYSANTANPTGQQISASGTASFGSPGSESFTLDAKGNIAFACASNMSSAVSVVRSGYSYNVVTKRFAQTLTLTNNSGSAISGPISLVLDGLSTNATLSNSSGATACAAPLGSPFIKLSGPLNPGVSVPAVLQFTDPTKTGISYTTRVLAGGVSE